MTQVQVRLPMSLHPKLISERICASGGRNESHHGGTGTSEVHRRRRREWCQASGPCTSDTQDHLTLLNAYNAFIKYGIRDKQWCGNHRINHKALSRAVSIRKQLKKFLDRFGIKVESCEGDAKRLRRCLVSGYFKASMRHSHPFSHADVQNAARMMPDGTYRSAREGAVGHATGQLGRTS